MNQISVDKVIEMLLSLTDRQTDRQTARQTAVSLPYLNTLFITDNEGILSIKDWCSFIVCFCLFKNLENNL